MCQNKPMTLKEAFALIEMAGPKGIIDVRAGIVIRDALDKFATYFLQTEMSQDHVNDVSDLIIEILDWRELMETK